MIKLLNQKKLLIFDLDETIYDHQYASLCGLNAIAKTFPLWQSYSLRAIENMYFEDLHQTHLKVIDGSISEESSHLARFQKIASYFKLSFQPSEYLQMIEIYNTVSKNSKRAIPNAPETILSLKNHGFKIALITNGRTENQKRKIQLCNISTSLDIVLISEEVGIRKPDKEIFELALELSKTHFSEAVMIGDSWDSDIEGALAANIEAVWVNRGRHKNLLINKVMEIQHVAELLNFFTKK